MDGISDLSQTPRLLCNQDLAETTEPEPDVERFIPAPYSLEYEQMKTLRQRSTLVQRAVNFSGRWTGEGVRHLAEDWACTMTGMLAPRLTAPAGGHGVKTVEGLSGHDQIEAGVWQRHPLGPAAKALEPILSR